MKDTEWEGDLSMTGFGWDCTCGGDYSRRAARGRSLPHLFKDCTYDGRGAGAAAPEVAALRVFNPEYRILKARERIQGIFPCEEKDLNGMMKNFLSAANGSSSYSVPIELVFDRLKECEEPESGDLVPLTLIACKMQSGRVFCSVERLSYSGSDCAAAKHALRRALYTECPENLIRKFREQGYQSSAVLGKGDFTRQLRKVFGEQFGFAVI
ncbi:hypothetical protein [Caproiciproducens faecalis]|uniref:Uncharacterized protein n=1 Tax=Caproiciproducens faecalis TaxID=2820301 RepID=A0ABS7DPI7_9FIRM|nr:hypothetical protein [Caproiciproducens faecalis]MBW7573219.1 hypothetical protein [Caproiciproducens faecalis]